MRHKYTIGHMFAGVGGGAYGCSHAEVRLGRQRGSLETLGGLELDEGAAKDFESLARAPCLVRDVRETQPTDLIRAWGPQCPDVVLSSPPCKAFSRLLPKKRVTEPKYQAMSRLMLEGTHLVLSTWPKTPRLLWYENVPDIMSRGHDTLIALRGILEAHDYQVAEGVHDCGEVGGLAQHRRRWFLVARHRRRLSRFVYRPPERRVRAVSEVLGELPLPLESAGGPLHELPRIAAITWARLASIPPGGDWRDLPSAVRLGGDGHYSDNFHVVDWDESSRTIATARRPGSGAPSVADPRLSPGINSGGHTNLYRVGPWDAPSRTVTGSSRPASGRQSVEDPRPHRGTYGVLAWDGTSGAVTGSASPTRGTFSVGDPRASEWYSTTVEELLSLDRPRRAPVQVPVVRSRWDTWNRPLTNLELAVLQGFPSRVDGEYLQLSGRSRTEWTRRIGNAIPPPAARRFAEQMIRALMVDDLGLQNELDVESVWVEQSVRNNHE